LRYFQAVYLLTVGFLFGEQWKRQMITRIGYIYGTVVVGFNQFPA